MIDRLRLLADLKRVVLQLEDDLRLRLEEDQPSRDKLKGEYEAARKAGRTAAAWETFRDDQVTQVAVAWVLATVFVRFVEDNALVDEAYLGGHRLQLVKDRYTHWLRQHPRNTDRDFLLSVFAELGRLPGLRSLLAEDGHSLVWSLGPTADGARLLREFWLGAGGHDAHDFSDAEWGTRFLGDLYQDLSEHAQKKYALLQTPEFIEEFLLDKTLEPALAEFGLKDTRIIDAACGSGHFLLGAFARLFTRWQKAEPAVKVQVLAQRALDAVVGVDLNPFAVAIARFRLLVAALRVCGVKRLRDAFDFRAMVANGDSLLHGPGRSGITGVRQKSLHAEEEAEFEHVYASEVKELLHAIFGRSYHAVVGNPPYIVARDKALNELYRKRWPEVCHRKYSLGVPFTQLFFELARPKLDEKRAPGFVGMITANSFMKREFGKKLIEEYLGGKVELTGMLDLSGAYIPGHGTPTVILLGRPRTAIGATIRAVLGIKGEPSTPEDPAKGLVWSAIVEQFERPGSESEFVSCADVPRGRFAAHPWSIGGGGAAELKDQIEEACERVLGDFVDSIGFASFPGADEVFLVGRAPLTRRGISKDLVRTCVDGESVRDWTVSQELGALVPFAADGEPVPYDAASPWGRYLWCFRTTIGGTVSFGGRTRIECGDQWWTWYRWIPAKYRTSLSITFAEVASHNHFVLDRGGKVFKQTAPVIKLPAGATEDDHLGLLGLLNSSVACFWLKQVCHQKQMMGGDGIRVPDRSKVPYQFASTPVGNLPVPDSLATFRDGLIIRLTRDLVSAAETTASLSADRVLDKALAIRKSPAVAWESAQAQRRQLRARMVLLQEEIDWLSYVLFGLADESVLGTDSHAPAGLDAGQRPFEILRQQSNEGFEVPSDIPANWPAATRNGWGVRMRAIKDSADLQLIEDPHYKRRWIGRQGLFNHQGRRDELETACCNWLLDRMESERLWPEPMLTTTARFAELLRKDVDFVKVANLYRGRDDYDFDALVRELITEEGVPFLPVQRYKSSGLRKHEVWERTWDLQRRQDAGEDVGQIPVPPKYISADFLPGCWRHRGKLDVPKERFVLYPKAEADDDPTPVFTWAGFDHLQQARSLAAWLIDRKEQQGWRADKLKPLYAGIDQLIPWVKQWHNGVDPETQQRLGDYFQSFLDQELRTQSLTIDEVRGWTPSGRHRRAGEGRGQASTSALDEESDL